MPSPLRFRTVDPIDVATTAQALAAPGKGILAADETVGTITKRFAALGIESTEASRCAYRLLMCTTPGLDEHISGVILNEETMGQVDPDGTPVPMVLHGLGILPGVKVDKGASPMPDFPGETVTEGLDDLPERLAGFRETGARFAKWRAVIAIGEGLPSRACVVANANALALYAAMCQEAGLVPIVEPEVLMEGGHTASHCRAVTVDALQHVFDRLADEGVAPEGIILKPNMVLAGRDCSRQLGVDEVAAMTLGALCDAVPDAVPGVAFLSGGQSPQLATAHLDALNRLGPAPWELTFSFGRALQDPVMATWLGEPANVPAAQAALAHRARCNGLARRGEYRPELELEPAG